MEARHLTITCARCGSAAAQIALLPAAPGEGQMWSDRDRLIRTGFMGEVIKFGPGRDLETLFDWLAHAQYSPAREQDSDLIAFICRQCELPYCETCWVIGAPEFDEGFYDCTRGVCPHGHPQVVDD